MKITVPAGVLRDMLTGSLTCTSTDMTTPALCAVSVTVADGILRVQSTDRFRAIFGKYEIPLELRTPDHFSVMIDRKDVKQVLSALPKGKGTTVMPVSIAVGGTFVVFDWGTGTSTVNIFDGQAPDLTRVIPSEDLPLSVDGLSFSGELLATLGSIPNQSNVPWTLAFYGASKPMTAKRSSDGEPSWMFLLMPVKLR